MLYIISAPTHTLNYKDTDEGDADEEDGDDDAKDDDQQKTNIPTQPEVAIRVGIYNTLYFTNL